MEADKITGSLEKYLKILSQPIRIDILKRLNNCQTSLSYSSLKKESSIRYPNSTNFSFHLKTLKNNHFIESQKNGYIISSFGKRILDGILNLEQDIIEENQTRMIRTSKYSKEPFNMSKIKEYLITEGEMDEILADQIASEVDERIRKARIKYLTAPLMREFINGILLEKGLERFRHKLTRLGTPPYEAFKLFSNPSMNPDTFLQKLGSDVSEQFLLLNLLPKELADSYLSGDIMLLNLNYWSLRPLSIVLDTELVVNFLARKLNLDFTRSLSPGDIMKSLSGFQSCLNLLKPYISGDLVFRDFVNQYLTVILSNEKSESFLFKLSEIIKHYNSSFNDSRSHLTLEFFLSDSHYNSDKESCILQDLSLFIKFLSSENNINVNMVPPSINFKYYNVNKKSFDYSLIKDLIKSYPNRKLVFQDGSNPGVLNSFHVKLNPILEKESIRNGIILDKILINLDKIASNANQIDEVFFDILYERMNEVFSFFKNKENLVKKKLNQESSWNSILKDLIKHDEGKWQENAHKSVSFYGLNKAVQQHCGIDLDRLESSENFALNIMSFMQKLIEKENSENNQTYLLSQPHIDDIDSRNPEPTRLIRENSGLSLNRQITLFKKFQAIMKGGSIFSFKLNDETSTLLKIFETIKEMKVEAFYFY